MKIYTKTGDTGTTSLYGGEITEKHSLRVDAYGTLDELQASVGFARALCEVSEVRQALKESERQLILLMTEVSSSKLTVHMIKEDDVKRMEQEIDRLCSKGFGFSGFVLPGECLRSAALHLARTIARRAERRIFALAAYELVQQPVLNYLNRLSDYLFVLSQCELKSTKKIGCVEASGDELMPYGVPDSWDETTDVAIIGSGFAGLAAAIEAGLKGANVIILEKMPYLGGNSRISGGGYCSWDSKLKLREKLGLGEDSPQLHKEDTLKGGAYYNDPDLVDRMVNEAPDGLNMLIEAGIEFEPTLHHLGAHSVARSYQEKNRSGKAMVDALHNYAKRCGAELRLRAKVTRLWRENAASPVTGLRYEQNGVQKNLRCLKGIVIASGGFARDTELIAQRNPWLGNNYMCSNHRGATGEVLRYAIAIGADTVHMDFIQLFPCAAAKNGVIDRLALECYSGAGFGTIYVNDKGLRFVNELAGRDEVSKAQLMHQTKPTWAVFNKDIFTRLNTPIEVLEHGVKSKRLIFGNTIEEMATLAGIIPDSLAATIDDHNEILKSGLTDNFNKTVTDKMLPMERGPYYAVAQWPSVHFCMGGLRINRDSQVLDISGIRIPKLYAAGEVCGGVHGANRLGGNAITECIVFGRAAGIGVANEKEY